MKAIFIIIATASLCLAGCTSYDGSVRTNTGRGSVAGPSSNWTAGAGGFGPVSQDSGSGIRGGGVGAGTSGSTATGWIAPTNEPQR